MSRLPFGNCKQLPSGQWRARYRDDTPERREHTRHFPTEDEGLRWLASVQTDLDRGNVILDAKGGRVTVRVYGEEWRLLQSHHRPQSGEYYESAFRRHIYPFLGLRELRSIRARDIQAWVRWLSTEQVLDLGKGREVRPPLASSTIAVLHGVLASMFLDAIRNKAIAESPCEDTKLPEDDDQAPVVPLPTEQVIALIEAFKPIKYRAVLHLGAGAGLRIGEAFGVTVDRIDFLRREIRIDRQLVKPSGVPFYLGPPKTKKSNRTIPLPKVTVDALAEHLARFPAEARQLPVGGKDHPTKEVRLLTLSTFGNPMHRSTFSEAFRRAADAVGIPADESFHSLRHYYASLLIAHGCTVKEVQARLGHASATETLDTYAHLWPDTDDRTRDAIDLVLGAPAEQKEKEQHQ